MGVEIISPANEAEWLGLREQDVTASVAAALLGAHPYTTAYGLWAEKAGRIDNEPLDGPQLKRGRLLEPVAIQLLREERPDWNVEYPLGLAYYRDPVARIGATPDAFAYRPDVAGRGTVQVKTVSDWAFKSGWKDPNTREVVLPVWIAVQAIIEAKLTGSSWAAVAAMVVGHGLELIVEEIPLHEGTFAAVERAVVEFWALMKSGATPDPDWKRDGAMVLDVFRKSDAPPIDLSTIDGLEDLVASYQDAKDRENAACKEAAELKPQIIAALGNAEGGDGRRFSLTAKTQHRKSFVAKASSSRVLRITKKEATA